MRGSTFATTLRYVISGRAKRLSPGILLAAFVFCLTTQVKAQTIYSPTTVTVTCTPQEVNGCSIVNPTGPETQSGGDATLISNPPAPPARTLWPTCDWKGFASVVLQKSATLSVPFQYQYPGKGSAEIYISYGSNGQSNVQFSSNYQGTVHFTIPAGTNLSTLSVEISIDGAVGYGAAGYVGWITVQ